MCWAEDFIIDHHAKGEGHSKVRAGVADSIELALISSNQQLVIFLGANMQLLEFAFTQSTSEIHFYLAETTIRSREVSH